MTLLMAKCTYLISAGRRRALLMRLSHRPQTPSNSLNADGRHVVGPAANRGMPLGISEIVSDHCNQLQRKKGRRS